MTGLQRKRYLLLVSGVLCGALLIAVAMVLFSTSSVSAGVPAADLPVVNPQRGGTGNDACLACHNQEDTKLSFPNGEELSATVNKDAYIVSVHAGQEMQCIDCHAKITGYPHPELTAQNKFEYKAQYSQTCVSCHERESLEYHDGLHSAAITAGNVNAPSCTDCHNPHTQGKVTDESGKLLPAERVNIPQQCANCHSTIFDEYTQSVHGEGILLKMNTDVATCTDCHGVHKIQDPTSGNYRAQSAEMCSNCHTDEAIMSKYGLSTNIMNSYVSDFHGTTIMLFEPGSAEELSNKPVCYDCHGVHNISKVDDPEKGLEVRQNLLKTCQKCHPNATDNFPDSWLSHYDPSPTKWPLVYYVNLFYQIMIPTVIGGMVLFVISDIIRRRIDAGKNRPSKRVSEETKEVSE
ncbi:MAG: cytochrome c3 family protein [Anaerolineaceae bacterium]